MPRKKFIDNIKRYRFEFKHLTVLFIVLLLFQIALSFIQKESLQSFLSQTQEWYQKDSAEKIADLPTTTLELLLKNVNIHEINDEVKERNIIQSFNIILSQQLLQQNVEDICIILSKENEYYAIDDGAMLYNFLNDDMESFVDASHRHKHAKEIFLSVADEIREKEYIYSTIENERTFHIFVPFVPNGEYQGVLYMCKAPNFEYITNEIISSYDEATMIYSSLILLGFLAMYYISSYTVKERNHTQKLLYKENEKNLKRQIIHEKESMFTKRIYHTHHKAEKVMGFIKEDLHALNTENYEEIKGRVLKYSNFISRVIYDMKWFDPPLQTIRGQMFRTDLNELLTFITNFIFLRITSHTEIFEFKMSLGSDVPVVNINEYVVWEIMEPLIQNCIEHSDIEKVIVSIITEYNADKGETTVTIGDNGKGIDEELLETGEAGRQKIFSENVSTKVKENQNTGYGCYIAYEMAMKRCGWRLTARNKKSGGAEFIIKIAN